MGAHKETWPPREHCVWVLKRSEWLRNTLMYLLLLFLLLHRDEYPSWQEAGFLTFPHFSDEEVYRPALNSTFSFSSRPDGLSVLSVSPPVEEIFTSFFNLSNRNTTLYVPQCKSAIEWHHMRQFTRLHVVEGFIDFFIHTCRSTLQHTLMCKTALNYFLKWNSSSGSRMTPSFNQTTSCPNITVTVSVVAGPFTQVLNLSAILEYLHFPFFATLYFHSTTFRR